MNFEIGKSRVSKSGNRYTVYPVGHDGRAVRATTFRDIADANDHYDALTRMLGDRHAMYCQGIPEYVEVCIYLDDDEMIRSSAAKDEHNPYAG